MRSLLRIWTGTYSLSLRYIFYQAFIGIYPNKFNKPYYVFIESEYGTSWFLNMFTNQLKALCCYLELNYIYIKISYSTISFKGKVIFTRVASRIWYRQTDEHKAVFHI